jgi:hypothetical protein
LCGSCGRRSPTSLSFQSRTLLSHPGAQFGPGAHDRSLGDLVLDVTLRRVLRSEADAPQRCPIILRLDGAERLHRVGWSFGQRRRQSLVAATLAYDVDGAHGSSAARAEGMLGAVRTVAQASPLAVSTSISDVPRASPLGPPRRSSTARARAPSRQPTTLRASSGGSYDVRLTALASRDAR